eukprot:m.140588 g.140588  ORF g.140588 m.140588 type:complete len:394 (+) comp22810_c0_seq1:55-1236(+)
MSWTVAPGAVLLMAAHCMASGRLFGIVSMPDHDGSQLIAIQNYTYLNQNTNVEVTSTSPEPCAVGTPCTVNAGVVMLTGPMAGPVDCTYVEEDVAGSILTTRDSTTAEVVRHTELPKGTNLFAVHDMCAEGCSNGESLVYEHCNNMAVMQTEGARGLELVCIMDDSTVTARASLPSTYNLISSGPIVSHIRLLMSDTYCVLMSSTAESVVFCLTPEYDMTKGTLDVTLSSFHHSVSKSIWGSGAINPIVALIGEHPQKRGALLVLAARTAADMGKRAGLYVGVITGPPSLQYPTNRSKLDHVVDLPPAYRGANADEASNGLAFLDYSPQYPNNNVFLLAAFYQEYQGKLTPMLVRTSLPWPSQSNSTESSSIGWRWPSATGFPTSYAFEREAE